MKIVSWNCNGAFRNKFERIAELNADVLIIQECENPETVARKNQKYHSLVNNHLWHGENKNKGLGVFVKDKYKIRLIELNHEWRGRSLKWFIPFEFSINNIKQKMLGLWSHGANAKAFAYIGQSWLFLQNNKDFFQNVIIAGDFNSNTIWDAWDRWWNHSDFVNALQELGLESIYHSLYKEKQGKEEQKTFYLQKNKNKMYHIDYMFASRKLINKSKHFKIHDFYDWQDLSDHVPIEWEFDLT